MRTIFDFLLHYGVFFLFGVVFIEQMGLPLPAAPFLLAAGALIEKGRLNLVAAIGLSFLGALSADLIWFYLGRYRGKKVLGLICRLSFRPDTCVTRAEDVFERHGKRYIFVTKFIPGLNVVIPPLAGSSGVSLSQFLLFDGLSSLLYCCTYVLLGILFRPQLKAIARFIERLGWWSGILILAVVTVYILLRYFRIRSRAVPGNH